MRFMRSVAIILSTSAFAGAPLYACVGEDDNSCQVNSDCASSKAAEDLKNVRCPKELYCLDGTCAGQCRERCEVTRSDVNPCAPPAQCAHAGGSADDTFLCTMLPVPCSSPIDCPLYRPPTADGGQSEWQCHEGECRYPGLAPATR